VQEKPTSLVALPATAVHVHKAAGGGGKKNATNQRQALMRHAHPSKAPKDRKASKPRGIGATWSAP